MHPFSSINTTAAWKKLCCGFKYPNPKKWFLLLQESDNHTALLEWFFMSISSRFQFLEYFFLFAPFVNMKDIPLQMNIFGKHSEMSDLIKWKHQLINVETKLEMRDCQLLSSSGWLLRSFQVKCYQDTPQDITHRFSSLYLIFWCKDIKSSQSPFFIASFVFSSFFPVFFDNRLD